MLTKYNRCEIESSYSKASLSQQTVIEGVFDNLQLA